MGKRRTFASAIDWPGWCRAGKTPEAAIEALLEYQTRYAEVVTNAEFKLPSVVELAVVESVTGNATTDFGAPGVVAKVQCEAISKADAARLVAIVEAAWRHLDNVVSTAPEELAKGSRGGGRDTGKIAAHVREPEGAYARKMGITTRGIKDVRPAIVEFIKTGAEYVPGSTAWPPLYAAMRVAWHALDHAWEIQDRSC